MVLLVQYTASSSVDSLRMRIEYSRNNIDWYSDTTNNIEQGINANATTTRLVGDGANYVWSVGTTSAATDGFVGSGTGARAHLSVLVPAKLRYVRVIFWKRAGDSNGALYAEINPLRQKD